jgi:hypothetical protein
MAITVSEQCEHVTLIAGYDLCQAIGSQFLGCPVLEILQHVFFSPLVQQPLVGHGLLIIDASRSHSDTPHSIGLLWTSDQPDAGTST